jgi:hypothetical protein
MTKKDLLLKLKEKLDELLDDWRKSYDQSFAAYVFDIFFSKNAQFLLLAKILFVHELYDFVYREALELNKNGLISELQKKIKPFSDKAIKKLYGDVEGYIKAQTANTGEHKKDNDKKMQQLLPSPEAFAIDIGGVVWGESRTDINFLNDLCSRLTTWVFARKKLAVLLIPKSSFKEKIDFAVLLVQEGGSDENLSLSSRSQCRKVLENIFFFLLREPLTAADSLEDLLYLISCANAVGSQIRNLCENKILEIINKSKKLSYKNFKAIVRVESGNAFMKRLQITIENLKRELEVWIDTATVCKQEDPPAIQNWRQDMGDFLKSPSVKNTFNAFVVWQKCLWNLKAVFESAVILIAFFRANQRHCFQDSILEILKQHADLFFGLKITDALGKRLCKFLDTTWFAYQARQAQSSKSDVTPAAVVPVPAPTAAAAAMRPR